MPEKKIHLDREKLIAHLREMWREKWEGRQERPEELAAEFFGPDLPAEDLRAMRKFYSDAYLEGAQDMLKTILDFDDDIRGVEALIALGSGIGIVQT